MILVVARLNYLLFEHTRIGVGIATDRLHVANKKKRSDTQTQ